MKFLLLSILIISTAYASKESKEVCEMEANTSEDQIGTLMECLLQEQSTDLTSKIADVDECEHCKENGKGEPCRDAELAKEQAWSSDIQAAGFGKVEHCSSSGNIFCFNGMNIKKSGANRQLMEFLCTDEKIPDGAPTLAFGICNLKEQIKTQDMSCYCQYVNGIKENGLAFHCTAL